MYELLSTNVLISMKPRSTKPKLTGDEMISSIISVFRFLESVVVDILDYIS